MSDKRIVLLALDGSKHANYSFDSPFQPPTEDWEKIMMEVRKQVEKIGNDFSFRCQAEKIRYEFLDKCDSNPGSAIVAIAKEKNAELIVMGTRGLSTLRRTVLGSVSDYVLHHTDCPIAVVPTPEDSAQAAGSS